MGIIFIGRTCPALPHKGGATMKTALNIQPLMSGERTGIGYYADGIVKALADAHPSDAFRLDYFAFDYTPERLALAEAYAGERRNILLNPCRLLTGTLSKLLWAAVPLPYSFFFGQDCRASLFFNYLLPPRISGRVLLTICDTVISDCPDTMRRLTRYSLTARLEKSIKRADVIVTISEFSKSRIIHNFGVDGRRIIVAPCGVDREHFHPSDKLGAAKAAALRYGISGSYILYLGTLEPRKNLLRLINAFALLKKKHGVPHKLVIVGRKGWQYSDILSQAERSGVSGDVIFTGYAQYSDLPKLICGADVFAFVSLYEGFGMPVLEAMACGTPVLTSNTTALREVADGAALTVNPLSVSDIASGLYRLLSDRKCAERYAELGLKRAQDFTWKQSAEKIYRAMRE